jgi:ribosomal protein S20
MRGATSREQAFALLPGTVSVIDRTARKGMIHRKAAARVKSRLARFVAALPA